MHFLLDGMFATTVERPFLPRKWKLCSVFKHIWRIRFDRIRHVCGGMGSIISHLCNTALPCISHSELEFSLNTHTPKSIQTRLNARVYTEKNQVIIIAIRFSNIPMKLCTVAASLELTYIMNLTFQHNFICLYINNFFSCPFFLGSKW